MSAPGLTKAERLAMADKPQFDAEYGTPLKRALVPKEDEAALIACWADVIGELARTTEEIAARGPDIIPQIEFAEITRLTDAQKAQIRKVGTVVVRNVVDDEKALKWKETLREYIAANPQADGIPPENPQFVHMYWSKAQVQARADPNVVTVQKAMNGLWTRPRSSDALVSLSNPVAYADRFRIRVEPIWTTHPPHIDGANIERWADDNLRSGYASILKGDWKSHDPYFIDSRIVPDRNIHKRPAQVSVFRTWQGWLAMSDTGPGEGTLQVFPSVQLANAYIVLRPFFRLKSTELDPLAVDSWEFDADTAHYPGVIPLKSMRLTDETHPHLRLNSNMTSMPRVLPGDMVFWHCDVIHAVEEEHKGKHDSSVLYIPACPMTLHNMSYLARQRASFLAGTTPPDYGEFTPETDFKGRAMEKDIVGIDARRAMGLEPFVVEEGMPKGERDLLTEANRLLAVN